MRVFPHWFNLLCSLSLALGLVWCAIALLVDVLRRPPPPHMKIMGIVWPISALFGTVFVLWLYFRRACDRRCVWLAFRVC